MMSSFLFIYVVGKILIYTSISFSGYPMSKTDLKRLMVRKTYFVPLKASAIKKAVLEELIGSEKAICGLHSWKISAERANSVCYTFSLGYFHVEDKSIQMKQKEPSKKLLEKWITELEKGFPESMFKILRKLRESQPFEIYLLFLRKEESGCTCKVECHSVLYERLASTTQVEAGDLQMQNAYLSCERFIEEIFEGGLSASLISEKEKKEERIDYEFLTNDVSTRQISRRIETMLDSATGEILIFAWIGTIHLKKLRELKQRGIELRVITGNVKTIRQDPMRKEKERAMRELISIIGKKNISVKPEFHGRAIIVDNKALIGSMDMDSYSLTGTRIEFATYTEAPETVRNLRNYFNRIFTHSKNNVD